MTKITQKIIDRCLKKIDFDSKIQSEQIDPRTMKPIEGYCWPWKGSKTKKGYGQVFVNYKLVLVHRLIWAVKYNNQIMPNADECILHNCGFKACCNPAHYRKGTQRDNNRDTMIHSILSNKKLGRPKSLSDEQVIAIRVEAQNPLIKIKDIALKYNTSTEVLNQLIHGRTYTNVGGPIKSKQRTNQKKFDFSNKDLKDIVNAYKKEHQSLNTIARKYGCSHQTIYKIIKEIDASNSQVIQNIVVDSHKQF